MSQTIKFKAWDKKKNKFIYHFSINPYGQVFTDDYSDEANENIILIEYTGLKDKNKKEIYEGDILRFKGRVDGNNREFILPVTFEIRGGFQMYLTGIRHYDIFSNEVEVIGNVFEDKNL